MLLRYLLSSVAVFNPPDEGTPGAPPDPGATPAAPEAGETPPEPGAGETPPAAEADEADPPAPAPSAADWRDREIRRKHAQLKDKDRAIEEMRRENEELRAIAERASRAQPAGGEDSPVPAPAVRAAPDADRGASVREEAARMLAKESYDRDCNAADAAGRKKYGADWGTAIERLTTLGTIDVETMVGLLATDDPAKVLYELGSNPDEFHRVMELPPAKRLNEMAKIAAKAEPRKGVSNAPAPVDPLAGRGTAINDELDDKLSDEEWYARRVKKKREKWLESQGRGARA